MKCDQIIDVSKQWIESVIIAHNFCPFARKVFQENSIYYEVIADTDTITLLTRLMELTDYLKSHEDLETVFLILGNNFDCFHQFLDLVGLSNDLLREQGEEGQFQLAHFHPDYRFDGLAETDAANYTNRSPYPMLHILREESLEQALEKTRSPEEIPLRNIEHARSLGTETFKRQLKEILKSHN